MTIPKHPIDRGEHGFYTRIAKATNISRQHVGKVLQGKASYSRGSLYKIARACSVEVGWLVEYIERVAACRELVAVGRLDLASAVDDQTLTIKEALEDFLSTQG